MSTIFDLVAIFNFAITILIDTMYVRVQFCVDQTSRVIPQTDCENTNFAEKRRPFWIVSLFEICDHGYFTQGTLYGIGHYAVRVRFCVYPAYGF